METFYLWGFITQGLVLIMTRGRTRQEAQAWAEKNNGRVVSVSFLPVNAAKAYSRSHPFDWLHTAPLWVQGKSYANLDA